MCDGSSKPSLVYRSYPSRMWWKSLKRLKKNHLNRLVVSMNNILYWTFWFFSSFLQNSSNTSKIIISVGVVVAIVDVHQYIQSPFGIASIASTNNLPEQTIPKRDGTTLFKWYFDFSLNCLLIVPFHFNSELGPETSHYLWIDERFTSRTTCICDFGRKSRSWNNENNQTCSIWRTWWEITTARC